MKILFVTNQLQVGGIETNLVRLAREFTARGHSVVAATAGGKLVDDFEAAGGTHHVMNFSLHPRSIRRSVADLRAVIEREQPALVHAFSASTAPPAWLALRALSMRSRVPLITSVMGLKISPDEARSLTYLRAYLITVGADRIVVIAPAIGDVLGRLPISRKRLVHLPVVGVPIPVDLGDRPVRRAAARQELQIDPDRPVVITMGNLEPRKSHELFIRAACKALDERPDTLFLVVGGGPLKEQLQQEIDASAYQQSIKLLDERTDGPDIIQAADVYVRPGVVEGFVGITVLEAQSTGIPVVSFETEDVKLAITDRETGSLVRNGDVDELASAINELLADDDLARDLVLRARAHVQETFSIEAVVDGLENLYRRELDRLASGRG